MYIRVLKGPFDQYKNGAPKDADLGANKDSCLDPLVFLAPSVLEPDSNDPGVQSCHLN